MSITDRPILRWPDGEDAELPPELSPDFGDICPGCDTGHRWDSPCPAGDTILRVLAWIGESQ